MTSRRNEAAIDEIVASCDGDVRGALKALLLVNEQLEAAGAIGRAGELGIIEGFIGAVPEPDIANYNWIAGHDLAFVGRAIADHPI